MMPAQMIRLDDREAVHSVAICQNNVSIVSIRNVDQDRSPEQYRFFCDTDEASRRGSEDDDHGCSIR